MCEQIRTRTRHWSMLRYSLLVFSLESKLENKLVVSEFYTRDSKRHKGVNTKKIKITRIRKLACDVSCACCLLVITVKSVYTLGRVAWLNRWQNCIIAGSLVRFISVYVALPVGHVTASACAESSPTTATCFRGVYSTRPWRPKCWAGPIRQAWCFVYESIITGPLILLPFGASCF
jgi:hypothetical protein